MFDGLVYALLTAERSDGYGPPEGSKARQILETEALLTMVGGEIVFAREPYTSMSEVRCPQLRYHFLC